MGVLTKRSIAVSRFKRVLANLAGVVSAVAIAWPVVGEASVLAGATDDEAYTEVADPLADFDADLQRALEQLVRDQSLWKAVESRKH